MPILLTKTATNPGEDTPYLWKIGEVVDSFPDDQVFGWKEFPHNDQGIHTVAEINAMDTQTIPVYSVVQCSDAGLVGALSVLAGDSLGLAGDRNWYNYGLDPNNDLPRAIINPPHFHQIKITDKTLEEVDAYLEEWKHDPIVEQIQVNGDDRRIEVTSTIVSATGKNAFTQVGVEALMGAVGGTYVSHTNTSFKFDITATLEEKDEIITRIHEDVEDMQYARRRWYINQAGRDYLNANDYIVQGTAAQVGGYLRDGLLD